MSSEVTSTLISSLALARAHAIIVEDSSLLSSEEIAQLRSQGNYSSDWSKLSFLAGLSPSSRQNSISHIHNCGFHGYVVIGSLSSSLVEGCKLPLPSGESFGLQALFPLTVHSQYHIRAYSINILWLLLCLQRLCCSQ